MNILALDLSLKRIGWARYTPAAGVGSGSFVPIGEGIARLSNAADHVEELAWAHSRETSLADLAVIEGYSFRSNTQGVALGELGGVIRWVLHLHGIPWVIIAPKQRAKYATGNGNAGKSQVLVEAVKRLSYAGHDEDEVDALWLLQATLAHYGLPGAVPMPRVHREILAKIEWPRDLGS